MKTTKPKLKVLFLCTGNSVRSQMAEGWARNLHGDKIEAYSAGIAPAGLSPNASRVMAEAGVDISGQQSKHVDSLQGISFDYVVTLCSHASEHCPIFPGKAKIVHADFDDPSSFAIGAQAPEDALYHYRRIRDEIKAFVQRMPENLKQCRK